MLLTFDETCARLRQMVADGKITAWNHRVDCRQVSSGLDIYIIDFLPGNEPRCVEWRQHEVERWLRDRDRAEAILGSL